MEKNMEDSMNKELKRIAKGYYNGAKTYGDFKTALEKDVPEWLIKKLWTDFSQSEPTKIPVKNLDDPKRNN